MVCPRCIMAVKNILIELEIQHDDVQLGQLLVSSQIDEQKLKLLGNTLKTLGFELLEPGKSALISKIKTVIIEQIHHNKEPLITNYSSLIAGKLKHGYASLSRLFSSVEGITIEKYIALQKVEKIKEYIIYNQLTLSQIAHEMHYSSVAHLSSQFKKETGMTPTQFKMQSKPVRKSLDSL